MLRLTIAPIPAAGSMPDSIEVIAPELAGALMQHRGCNARLDKGNSIMKLAHNEDPGVTAGSSPLNLFPQPRISCALSIEPEEQANP